MLRKWLILVHRYLGTAMGLLFLTWFLSGIVMIYTGGMPQLDPQLRLARLPPLDLSRVRVSAETAAAGRQPDRATLLTIMDRPAYRFDGGRTVFADTGEALARVGPEQAREIAARFVGGSQSSIDLVGLVERPDQWTLTQPRQLPAHKFTVNDGSGTEIYVSTRTAEVALVTTRRDRALAWIGAIPHWLYFTPLRRNPRLWTDVVVYSSELGCVLAVVGLVLGVVQFRRTRPFRLSGSIPYAGWMRWHYITGVVFGVFTLTWVFSGLMSMEPFDWTRREGLELDTDLLSGGAPPLSAFTLPDPAVWSQLAQGREIKQIEFARIQDEPYYVVQTASPEEMIVHAGTLTPRREPFSVESLVNRLRVLESDGAPITETALLTSYDSYYYSRDAQAPLPVLRVKFGDPDLTWVYIDPKASQFVRSVHRSSRLERWLFNGLHSLDFSFWYNSRPLWDIGMIALSLGGFASSALGLWVGVKRVRRWVVRA